MSESESNPQRPMSIYSGRKPKQSKAWMIGVLLGLVVIAVLVWFFVFKDGGCKDDEEMVGTKCLVKCTDDQIRIGEVCKKKGKHLGTFTFKGGKLIRVNN